MPSWAFIDSVVGGVRTVADQAHQKILENQLVQLVLEAKKNYDASMKIYKQVKQLNEGRGLVLKSRDRVNIEFSEAVLPDGREIAISGIALAPDGSAGTAPRINGTRASFMS